MPSVTSWVPYREFSENELREIVFKDITTGEVTHTTVLDTAGIADYRSAIGYFAQTIMRELRLISGYEVLYGKVKTFVQRGLFDRQVDLRPPIPFVTCLIWRLPRQSLKPSRERSMT